MTSSGIHGGNPSSMRALSPQRVEPAIRDTLFHERINTSRNRLRHATQTVEDLGKVFRVLSEERSKSLEKRQSMA